MIFVLRLSQSFSSGLFFSLWHEYNRVWADPDRKRTAFNNRHLTLQGASVWFHCLRQSCLNITRTPPVPWQEAQSHCLRSSYFYWQQENWGWWRWLWIWVWIGVRATHDFKEFDLAEGGTVGEGSVFLHAHIQMWGGLSSQADWLGGLKSKYFSAALFPQRSGFAVLNSVFRQSRRDIVRIWA